MANLTVPIQVNLPEDWKEQIIERLRNDPESEWVPVVRCRDCVHYEISRLKKDGTDDKRYKRTACVNGATARYRTPDWYCADAKRRTDG